LGLGSGLCLIITSAGILISSSVIGYFTKRKRLIPNKTNPTNRKAITKFVSIFILSKLVTSTTKLLTLLTILPI